MEWEKGFFLLLVVEFKGKLYVLSERIACFLSNGYGNAVGYERIHCRRCVYECRDTLPGRGVPQVLHQLGPALVEVRRAAGIACKRTEQDVGVIVWSGKLTPLAGDVYLVELLVILPRREIVGYLRG